MTAHTELPWKICVSRLCRQTAWVSSGTQTWITSRERRSQSHVFEILQARALFEPSQIALGQEINDLKRFFGYDALLIGGRTARALRDGRWR